MDTLQLESLVKELSERLNRELRAVLEQAPVRQRLIDWGGTPQASTPAQFRSRVENEIRQLSRIVTERKIESQ